MPRNPAVSNTSGTPDEHFPHPLPPATQVPARPGFHPHNFELHGMPPAPQVAPHRQHHDTDHMPPAPQVPSQ